jgi:hypothetical protein
MTWKGFENATVDPATGKLVDSAAPVAKTGKKKNKFNAKRTQLAPGLVFDSQHEADRWVLLSAREALGEIANLRRQVEFELTVLPRDGREATGRGFHRVGVWKADFTYYEDGALVVEDAKSKPTKTPLYRWKARHVEIEHCVNIREV